MVSKGEFDKLPKLSNLSDRLKGQRMFQILSETKALEKKGQNILHFELGDPEFDTPLPVIEKTIQSLKSGRTHYESSFGVLGLREKAVEVTSRSRKFIPKIEQVLVTPGANYQIYLALACIADKGDEVIIPDPGFVSYSSICNFLDLRPVSLHLKETDNFQHKASDIEKLITSKTKVIIINSPGNPTGGVTEKKELEAIYELAEKFNIWILSDEIYARIIYPEGPNFFSIGTIDQCKKRTIIINGFSKAYAMTGWRVGVVIAPDFLIIKMNLLLESTLSCVPAFIQDGALEALSLEEKFWKSMVDDYKKRRDNLVKGLNSIKGFTCLLPFGAFYAFPNIKGTGLNDLQISKKLLYECGIAVTPGSYFGTKGVSNIRFSYVCGLSSIDEAIKRLQACFGLKSKY